MQANVAPTTPPEIGISEVPPKIPFNEI